MSNSGPTWRALVGALLVASCTITSSATPSNPTAAPASAVLPSSTAMASPTEAPSEPPTQVPGPPPIGADWELQPPIDGARVFDIAHGPSGWVAGGYARCREPGCGRWVAGAWFSSDGVTWTGGPVPDARDARISTVATDGKQWFAAGLTDKFVGDTFRWETSIWRSRNGRTWTLVGSIPLGRPEKGIGPIGELAAGPGGVILTWVDPGDPERRSVYWSENGERWKPIEKGMFGLPPDGYLAAQGATVADGRFVLVTDCEGCGTIWSSGNGRDWTLDATLGGETFGLAVATDGRRVIVVDQECAEECVSHIWVSEDGRTGWTRAAQVLPVGEPLLTFAADTFILTGAIEDRDDPERGTHVFTSPDGISWTEFVQTDFRTTECYVGALEGAEDRVVLQGLEDCAGIWVSRAPG